MTIISSTAVINAVRLKEQGSSPATPASGYGLIYEKSDGLLYFMDDAGTEMQLADADALVLSLNTMVGALMLEGAQGNVVTVGSGNVLRISAPSEAIQVACSDETTALTVGTGKVTFRMPFAMTVTAVRASVTTAPTGSVLTVDINDGGTSILSTKLTIDASEKTSTTAATPPVISDTALADDAEITIDIDGVGSTIAGAGLKVTLIGTRA